jgi:3-oxoacyl-[acyl-carrier protein] reductase
MFTLHEKNVLITGSTGGIGRAIAHSFLQVGANVVLSGTKQQNLEDLKGGLQSEFPSRRIEFLQTNLMDNGETDALFEKAQTLIGDIHVLINNAGITRDGLLLRMSDTDWMDVMNVNLTSVFRLSKAAVKAMMRHRYGRIINISSVVAISGNAGQTNYCAAKAGMIGFSKALAQEVASRNITVNCIAPGFIDTEMTEHIPEKTKELLLQNIPLKKMGLPLDIAAAAVFLASNEAQYITGQTLHVNGGLQMV